MEFDPAALTPTERYKLLIGGIVPRPIALVSTISPSGAPNLAPFSFFAGVGSDPMMLLFCPANKPDGTPKDTLRNCAPITEGGTGEFVVNVVSFSFAHRMAAAAEPLPHGESEFELTGLNTAPSRVVRPARVAEAAVAFECHTEHIIRTNPGQPAGGNVVLGRVQHVFVRDDAINERLHVDPGVVDAIGRMGGLSYCLTRQRFELPMGRDALRNRPDVPRTP